jgi:hypothetical protein
MGCEIYQIKTVKFKYDCILHEIVAPFGLLDASNARSGVDALLNLKEL